MQQALSCSLWPNLDCNRDDCMQVLIICISFICNINSKMHYLSNAILIRLLLQLLLFFSFSENAFVT